MLHPVIISSITKNSIADNQDSVELKVIKNDFIIGSGQ
jgi:hypothetical protein